MRYRKARPRARRWSLSLLWRRSRRRRSLRLGCLSRRVLALRCRGPRRSVHLRFRLLRGVIVLRFLVLVTSLFTAMSARAALRASRRGLRVTGPGRRGRRMAGFRFVRGRRLSGGTGLTGRGTATTDAGTTGTTTTTTTTTSTTSTTGTTTTTTTTTRTTADALRILRVLTDGGGRRARRSRARR